MKILSIITPRIISKPNLPFRFTVRWLISFYVYYVGNWKRGKRDGYGVQESYGKLAGGGDGWLTTVLDGSWKQDKFHGWGRMLEFEEIDELLGLASGIESNLRYEGKVY